MRHRSESYVRQPVTGARWLLGVLAAVVNLAQAQTQTGLTEEDFFEPVPVVLTVSRLAQSLHDTPGAVTVLDRDAIRRSGARDLADVLRLVPGYVVSGYNGAHQIGAYHAVLDEYGTRNLVLVNGRSLYTSTYLGGTMRGMSSVRLEDVERVEVLRGSNSAAYGANALFGVINVITRHTADTLGQEAALAAGSGGLGDVYARLGWGNASHAGTYRLSVGQRTDDGYAFVNDDRRIDQFNWQADWRLGGGADLALEVGTTRMKAGEGFTDPSNPQRQIAWSNQYAALRWKRDWSESEASKFMVTLDRDRTEDHFLFTVPAGNALAGFNGTLVDVGAREQRVNVEFQHQRSESDRLRWVAGVGLKQDKAWSRALFGTDEGIKINDTRLFSSLEWRFHPDWLINASIFAGHNSESGAYLNPRLFLNYHVNPRQTFRVGLSEGQRNPTLYENLGNRRVTSPSSVVANLYQGTGALEPETLRTVEAGYFARLEVTDAAVDVRLFRETFRDYVTDVPLSGLARTSVNFADGLNISGIEAQLRWEVSPSASLWVNQAFLDTDWRIQSGVVERNAPTSMTTVAWFQRLSPQWDWSMQVHARNKMNWRSANNNTLEPTVRADLRVARTWKTDGRQGELAFNLQSFSGDQTEFVVTRASIFKRRAFVTLRMEF